MRRLCTAAGVALASALTPGSPHATEAQTGATASSPAPLPQAPAPHIAATTPAQPRRAWDAAIGFIASYAPEYAGGNRWALGVKPGGWVRWGRVSIATRSSFVVRSGDPVSSGGVRIDLSPGERLRIGLSLRQDSGRQESDSGDLRGLGDVRRTIRMRLGASYPLETGWRAGATLSIDALGRGGGEMGDISLVRSVPLVPEVTASLTAAVAFGSRRYMQAYYGVDEAQAARSGYPIYSADGGLRDISLSAGVRSERALPWVFFGGASVARLIGPAAASPLTRERNSWSVSAGVAYRF